MKKLKVTTRRHGAQSTARKTEGFSHALVLTVSMALDEAATSKQTVGCGKEREQEKPTHRLWPSRVQQEDSNTQSSGEPGVREWKTCFTIRRQICCILTVQTITLIL